MCGFVCSVHNALFAVIDNAYGFRVACKALTHQNNGIHIHAIHNNSLHVVTNPITRSFAKTPKKTRPEMSPNHNFCARIQLNDCVRQTTRYINAFRYLFICFRRSLQNTYADFLKIIAHFFSFRITQIHIVWRQPQWKSDKKTNNIHIL